MRYLQNSALNVFLGTCLSLFCLGLAHAGGGISGSGRSYGEITAFGSIFVNGIEYSTTTATITVKGVVQPVGDQSALKVGMAVLVEGTINPDGLTGTATTVDFLGDLEGTIDAAPVIIGTRGSFSIYGLVVKTDSKTVYADGLTLAALRAGDVVEVSGLFNANDGSFAATRIEKQVAFRKAELRGFISNLTATTFKLGATLVVNYSAAQFRDLPPGGLVNGLFVEVKATTPPVGGTLNATRVSAEGSVLASADIRFGLLQGVAANVSTNSFMMGNQLVMTNAQTVFSGFNANPPAPALATVAPTLFDAGNITRKGGVPSVFAELKLAAPAEYASLTAATSTALVNGVQALATGPVVNGVMTAETVTITALPVSLLAVQSRMTHGTAGTFDLLIDKAASISGAVTVEPRNNGVAHTIVFQFDGPVTSVGGVTSQNVNLIGVGTASFAIAGNDVLVTLTGIPDNQRLTVALTNVNVAGINASAAMGFLVGDVNNSRSVNASDISGVKSRAGQTTDGSNFKFDVNATGGINASDISAVKARSGYSLSP